jgi:hypothetical protein
MSLSDGCGLLRFCVDLPTHTGRRFLCLLFRNAGSEKQHEQNRRTVSLERGSGAEIAIESAYAGARRRADGKKGEVHLQPLV